MRDSKTLVVSLFALLAFGCDRHRVEESKREEFRFTTGEHTIVEVRIDDGSVKVVGGASGVVEVVFDNQARAADRAGAQALLESLRFEAIQDGDVVRVKASSLTLGGGVWTSVTLRVPPRAIELDIRTEDGRLEIERVSGAIVAETGDGRIRMADVEGTVKLRTGDGSITGENLTGDFDVLTGDGRIRLDGNFGQLRVVTGDGSIRVRVSGRDMTTLSNDWSLRTSDGSIELTLPKDLDAKLDATTGDGRINNNFSRFEGTERRSRMQGTLGNGGPLILLVTMDGRISLKES